MSTPAPILCSPRVNRGLDIEEISTYDEIAAKCEAVHSLLRALKIPLHRESALAKILRDAQRVATDFREGHPLHSGDALFRTAHANRVASAILAVGPAPAARECLRRMTSGALDSLDRLASSGKDALWEIEFAAKLALQGLEVELAEPDVVLQVNDEPYPVSCKKIYSERGVKAQMRKGVKQLERFGAPGLVAFNIDELTPERSIFVSPDSNAAGDRLAVLNRAFIDRHQHVLERFVADGRCHGVLVTVNVIADLVDKRPRLNTFSQTTVWTLAPPHRPASAAFEEIIKRLQRRDAPS